MIFSSPILLVSKTPILVLFVITNSLYTRDSRFNSPSIKLLVKNKNKIKKKLYSMMQRPEKRKAMILAIFGRFSLHTYSLQPSIIDDGIESLEEDRKRQK